MRALIVLLLLAVPALAHDGDTKRDEYLGSLMSPKTGASCCNLMDCSETDDWRAGASGYEVFVDGAWQPVPPDAVIKNRPHPEGRAVVCYRPGIGVLCFVEGMAV